MKLELDPLQQVQDHVLGWISMYQERPMLYSAGIVLASPFVLALGLATSLILLASYRWIRLQLGLDMYSHVPRPAHSDKLFLLQGDLGLIRKMPPVAAHLKFAQDLETEVFVYRGLFYSPRIFLSDTKAMTYILSSSNSYNFPKPENARLVLKSFLGEGVLIAEGDVHKRQRKILQPAFGVSAIRELTPIFMKYSIELANKIGEMVDRSAQQKSEKLEGPDGIHHPFKAQSEPSRQVSKPGAPVFDVSFWITRAALDIIGDAGFAYKFHAVSTSVDPNALPSIEEREGDILGKAFGDLFKASMRITLSRFLQIYISSFYGLGWVADIPTQRQRAVRKAYCQLEDVSLRIVQEKKKEILREMQGEVDMRTTSSNGKPNSNGSNDAAPSTGALGFKKSDFDEKDSQDGAGRTAPGKDLLHLMMRANMSVDIASKEKLDDHELIGQITTLLLAGHETTSNQTSWTLYTLASHPEVENKLRKEIHDHFGSKMERREISYDELMNMEYLDCVCKEMLRFISAVPNTVRVASKSDVIPLSKAYPARDGRSSFSTFPISKGQEMIIPIQAINFSQDLWGPDAQSFNPERWLDLPSSVKNSGLPMHLMTFISGPRGCIGNRFALAEFKTMLCHLIGRFHFEKVEGWEVERKQSVVVRPRIIGQEDLGPQMPLRVSRI